MFSHKLAKYLRFEKLKCSNSKQRGCWQRTVCSNFTRLCLPITRVVNNHFANWHSFYHSEEFYSVKFTWKIFHLFYMSVFTTRTRTHGDAESWHCQLYAYTGKGNVSLCVLIKLVHTEAITNRLVLEKKLKHNQRKALRINKLQMKRILARSI